MNINHTDLVLEIGSGNNPHSRSDILCDRYIRTSHERAGEFPIRIDRPMVIADAMHLPFADHTFDYVIASHIFEHMDDPAGLAREIARVGKAGFIEVPSAISERVFGWDFHHWYCEIISGTLTFTRKTEGKRFDGFFHTLIARNIWFRRFFEQHKALWYTRLEWQGTIPMRIAGKPMRLREKANLDVAAWDILGRAKKDVPADWAFAIRFFLRRMARKLVNTARQLLWQVAVMTMAKQIVSSILRRCVCPACRGLLEIKEKSAHCPHCRAEYPVDGVLPVLLLPHEQSGGY